MCGRPEPSPEPAGGDKAVAASQSREAPTTGGGSCSWLRTNVEVLKLAAAIVAGVFALVEYQSKDHIDRVKNSADTVEKYYASKDYNALLALHTFQLSDEYQLKIRSNFDGQLSSADFRLFIRDRVKQSHTSDLLAALRGLKGVSACAIQGRCERAAICTHLAQTMQDLRCNYRDNIAELSLVNGSCLADEMNYLLDNYCTDWMASYLGVPQYTSIKDNKCLYDKAQQRSLIGDFCAKSIIYKRQAGFFKTLLGSLLE